MIYHLATISGNVIYKGTYKSCINFYNTFLSNSSSETFILCPALNEYR